MSELNSVLSFQMHMLERTASLDLFELDKLNLNDCIFKSLCKLHPICHLI